MKTIFSLILLIAFTSAFSKPYQQPKKLHSWNRLREGQSIVCGTYDAGNYLLNFGFRHELRIYSIRDKQFYSLIVKRRLALRSRSAFAYILPEGTYTVMNQAYRHIGFFKIAYTVNPINREALRNAPVTDFKGKINADELTNYILVATSGQVHYIGEWGFHRKKLSFGNDSGTSVDAVLHRYSTIDKEKLSISIPR